MKKTSVFQNSLIWFGAGVSIAEILTGTYFAPLGMAKGFAAILLGHLIGCTMMFFAGLIGGRTGLSAMETSKLSFGKKGSLWFAALNVLQLVGWTAIMIYDGALAANGIAGVGAWLWCLVIGALILVWILIGLTDLGRINQVVMVLLFVLTLVMCKVIFFGGNGIMTAQDDSLSFGAAVELAVAMPLSWLPVISDYTSRAEKPVLSNTVSNIAYFLGSCWMFVIGLGCAIATGYADISLLMRTMGMGAIGLVIIILSTITSSFLDARSAAISFTTLSSKPSERTVAVIVCIIGFAIAIFDPTSSYQDFLYLIGSFFTPMVGVLLTEYYILKQKDVRNMVSILNFVVYIIGFLLYRELLNVDIITGTTLPVVIIVGVLTYIANKAFAKH